jgi:hypothetical protein
MSDDLMLHGALNMPLPNDPAECDIVTWVQFKARARQASDLIKKLESPAPIAFGKGDKVINTGHMSGRPAVFIAPAKHHGEVGSSAARENHPSDALVKGEIVLTFPTPAQARRVADALCHATPLTDPRVAALVALIKRAQDIIDPCYPAKHAVWQNDARAALSALEKNK